MGKAWQGQAALVSGCSELRQVHMVHTVGMGTTHPGGASTCFDTVTPEPRRVSMTQQLCPRFCVHNKEPAADPRFCRWPGLGQEGLLWGGLSRPRTAPPGIPWPVASSSSERPGPGGGPRSCLPVEGHMGIMRPLFLHVLLVKQMLLHRPRRNQHCHTWISDFQPQNFKRVNFCV